jgi:hypothetical protein
MISNCNTLTQNLFSDDEFKCNINANLLKTKMPRFYSRQIGLLAGSDKRYWSDKMIQYNLLTLVLCPYFSSEFDCHLSIQEITQFLRKFHAIHMCLRVDRVMSHLNPCHIPTL